MHGACAGVDMNPSEWIVNRLADEEGRRGGAGNGAAHSSFDVLEVMTRIVKG